MSWSSGLGGGADAQTHSKKRPERFSLMFQRGDSGIQTALSETPDVERHASRSRGSAGRVPESNADFMMVS